MDSDDSKYLAEPGFFKVHGYELFKTTVSVAYVVDGDKFVVMCRLGMHTCDIKASNEEEMRGNVKIWAEEIISRPEEQLFYQNRVLTYSFQQL